MSFSDNFNRAAGAIGSPWTDINGAFSTDGTRAYCSSSTSIAHCVTVVDAGSRTYSVEIIVYGITDSWYGDGLVVALTDNDNYILFRLTGVLSSLEIYSKSVGTFSSLIGSAEGVSIADGTKLRVSVASDTYQCYITPPSGSESMVWSTSVLLNGFTGTKTGLYARNSVAGGVGSGSSFDNFAWSSGAPSVPKNLLYLSSWGG